MLKVFHQKYYVILGLFFLALAGNSCKKNDLHEPAPETTIATKWADLTLDIFYKSFSRTPTYASRSLGYMGLVMYESVVHADPAMKTMSGQLNGLNNLPLPEAGQSYDWLIALNEGQKTMLELLYPSGVNLSAENFKKIDSLREKIFTERSKLNSSEINQRSVKFGADIANAIYEWSKTDGGHNGFQKNFDPNYSFPTGASYWVPPVGGQTVSPFPLHPHWGKNRTFAATNSLLPIPAIIPYSKDPSSDYYKVYNAVYLKNKSLTQEEKETAAWWADDPTETFSPPGHSYNIATIVIKKSNAGYLRAAETYARVGLAVADAFICCWKVKVVYFNERPSSYVRANIDPAWRQYWPEPPFPAFPSGHSTQSAAAATVMAALYGENFEFTDNSHEGAKRFSADLQFRARKFTSFWQTAQESAYSRFLGGIHTQQDNDVGLAQGKKIGENINALKWKN